MKQEDFFTIMDCASDDDITEMMQHRRFRQVPSGEEEITVKQTAQKKIRMSRRSAAAGTAVAAALLALNVGGGYLLLHGKDDQQASTAESTVSIQESTEQEAMPRYCRLMQEYYAGSCQEPCDYDFTGLGMDLDETWENDEYRITVNAVVGCDWLLYYFYDVEPKQGQTYEEFWNQTKGYMVELSVETDPPEFTCFNGSMPGWSGKSDNGVWHCVGLVYNANNKPFFTGKKEPPTLQFGVHFSEFVSDADYVSVQPAFTAESYAIEPYDPTNELNIVRDQDCLALFDNLDENMKAMIENNPPMNSVVTPFGIFCRSKAFDTKDFPSNSVSYLFYQSSCEDFCNLPFEAFGSFTLKDAAGNCIAVTDASELSNYGERFFEGEGNTELDILFRKPLDLSQGTRIERVTDQENTAQENDAQKTAADAAQPQYVLLMQEYYNKLTDSQYYEGKTFEPCDYDFTELGKDIDYTFEWDDYKLTYRAVVGCDWVLYYFFDVEPKKGQDYQQFMSDNPDMTRIAVSMIKDDNVNYECTRLGSRSTVLPEQNTSDVAPDNGVWHCVGMIRNVTDQPFFHGENAGTQISFAERDAVLAAKAQQTPSEVLIDFETKEYPLRACEQPEFLRDETNMAFEPVFHEELEAMLAQYPMTRCAETPFGKYFVSDTAPAVESFRTYDWVGPSLVLKGIAPRTLDATYFGEFKSSGEEIAHLLALYDRPAEAEEAE